MRGVQRLYSRTVSLSLDKRSWDHQSVRPACEGPLDQENENHSTTSFSSRAELTSMNQRIIRLLIHAARGPFRSAREGPDRMGIYSWRTILRRELCTCNSPL
jgi:hypothetical protein